MYAVIQTGGRQYKVSPGDVIEVNRLPVEVGQTIDLANVLMIGNGPETTVGRPTVPGAVVRAEVADNFRSPKIIVFKYKAKVRYRKFNTHRQDLTRLVIKDILPTGVPEATAEAAESTPIEPATAAPVESPTVGSAEVATLAPVEPAIAAPGEPATPAPAEPVPPAGAGVAAETIERAVEPFVTVAAEMVEPVVAEVAALVDAVEAASEPARPGTAGAPTEPVAPGEGASTPAEE